MHVSIAAVIGTGIVFALLGATVPRLSDALLRWRRRSYEEWFEDSANDVSSFRLEHGRAPSSKARGHEGALGIWEGSLRRMAGDRALSQGQARRAIEAVGDGAFSEGFDIGSLPSDDSIREEFSLPFAMKTTVLCMLALAAAGVSSAIYGMSLVASVLYAGIVALCAVVALCDLRCRTIPFVLPLALAVLGAAYQAVALGFDGLAGAAVVALCAAGLLLAVSFVGSCYRGRMPMGAGDLATMPAVALCAGWPGFVYGLIVGFACGAIALVAVRIARKGFLVDKRVPLGPSLALCAATGAVFSIEAMSSLFA